MKTEDTNLDKAERRYGDLPLETDAIYWLLREQAEQSKRIADSLERIADFITKNPSPDYFK